MCVPSQSVDMIKYAARFAFYLAWVIYPGGTQAQRAVDGYAPKATRVFQPGGVLRCVGRFLSVHTTHNTGVARDYLGSRKTTGKTRAMSGHDLFQSSSTYQHIVPPRPTLAVFCCRFCCFGLLHVAFFVCFFTGCDEKVCRGDGAGARNVRLPTVRAGLLARAVRRR